MGNIKYVLMAISICLSVFSSCLLRSFSNKKLASNSGDLFLFNAALSVVWAVVLGIWYLASSDSGASPMAFAFGAAYGVIMCAFLFTKTCSLGEGPVSLTTLIGIYNRNVVRRDICERTAYKRRTVHRNDSAYCFAYTLYKSQKERRKAYT